MNWRETNEPDNTRAYEKTKVGCLQRIADATEKMSNNHADLLDRYQRALARIEAAQRTIRGLRGVQTKLRNQIKRAQQNA